MTRDKTKKDENLTVLALEDSAGDFEVMKELLIDAGYQLTIERVETEDAFASSLRGQAWDIILADFKLPGFDAFGALRIRNEICPDTPFICVAGSIGEESAIELLKSGAVDYVIKDRPDRLPFAVGRALDEARVKRIHEQNDEALKDAYRQLKASQAATLSILEDLVTALEEKTRLVSELTHRTNNNMQVIQALLQYRLSAHPELPLAQFVKDVTGQIHSMAQAQQELFRAGHLSRIDLASYLQSLVKLVQDRYPDERGQVSISLDLKPFSILLDSAVPLGIVVNELVTNAFRHAFSGEREDGSVGEIAVACAAAESGEIEVRVSDNGIGWSPAGGGAASGGGGLGLARALVEQQLSGTIAFDGSTGTTCIVRFRDNWYEERV